LNAHPVLQNVLDDLQNVLDDLWEEGRDVGVMFFANKCFCPDFFRTLLARAMVCNKNLLS
jgi:hypothetical protein